MILRQFLHNDPVGASYVFGRGGKGLEAVSFNWCLQTFVDNLLTTKLHASGVQAGYL